MTVRLAEDSDLLNAIGKFRRELDDFALALVLETATDRDRDRMQRLFADFAGVIRLTQGTKQIGRELSKGQS